ncbi:hypothetical protein V1477_011582 [Vespula maculifrons]|uniref:Maturase K n=1 Tax=Vespula maculifrons TaxID=7453 RepID=A0ABD2BZL2_VESMC
MPFEQTKSEVGIVGFERRQQSRAFDRLLVQLCFGLRRGNIEIFTGCHSTDLVVLWTSTREHRNFHRMPLERVFTNSLRKYNIILLIFSKFYAFSFASDIDFAFSKELENRSPR